LTQQADLAGAFIELYSQLFAATPNWHEEWKSVSASGRIFRVTQP
jgi:hypothetical protein